MTEILFRQLFDAESNTFTYLLADPRTGEAALIDPVSEHIDRDTGLLRDLGLELMYVLETHVHADHVTSAGVLRQRLGATTVVGAATGSRCADRLMEDGEVINLGGIEIEARHTPGHTSGCVTYVVEDDDGAMAFTGDALMIRGCGRTDFQQGDASTLYDSVWSQILSLPDATRIFPGHDYQGRTMSTVEEEKRLNPRLGEGKTKPEFLEIMAGLKLANPKMIDLAVPANMQCGLSHVDRWADVTRTDDEVPEVGVDWVRDHASEVRLIDVRNPPELEGELGALAGADNIPLGELEARLHELDAGAPTVVFCRSGGRSGTAARLMEKADFRKVASMRGGMLAYRRVEPAEAAASCG